MKLFDEINRKCHTNDSDSEDNVRIGKYNMLLLILAQFSDSVEFRSIDVYHYYYLLLSKHQSDSYMLYPIELLSI